jgi:cytochrome P450
MVMASFDPGHVRRFYPTLQEVGERLVARWQGAARSGRTIDLQADLMRFTVDAVAGLAFGADVNTLQSDEDVIQKHLSRIFPAVFNRIFAPLPVWRWWPSAADRELRDSVAAVNTAVDGFIVQARARLLAEPDLRQNPRNLLEAMLVAADEHGSGIDDKQVAGNVLVMLLAGEDTTANTLAWMVWLLSRHPEALARASDEVRGICTGDTPTMEELARLDYVEAVTHEAMRLKPVAPQNGMEALRDTVLGDVKIEAGMVVIAAMRRDAVNEHLIPDAASFSPERWLGEGNAAANSAKRVSMPFGAGPRICPGRYLALLEIKLAMAVMLAHFDILEVTTPDGREPRELLQLAMGLVGLRMRLRERVFTST